MPIRHLLLPLALVLAGWGAGQDAADVSPADAAALRFLHLSPDAPLVDVVIDGRLHLRDLGLRDRTPFHALPAGRYEVQVYPHRLPVAEEPVSPSGAEGSPSGDPEEPADGADTDAAADGASGPAEGDAAPAAVPRPRSLEAVSAVVQLEAGTYTTLVLTGNFELPTSEERRGHLSLDVEPAGANVTVSGPQGFRTQRSGDQLFTDLEPGEYEIDVHLEGYQSAAYTVEVPAGGTAVATVTLQQAEGTEDAGASEPFTQPEAAQGSWRRLELQPYTGELAVAAPDHALVRFVHAAPTVPHLEIRVTPPSGEGSAGDEDGEGTAGEGPSEEGAATAHVQVDRLSYPDATEYFAVPAGPHDLEFLVAGTDSILHALAHVDLRPGFTYTLFVAAGPVSGEIWLVPSVDAAVLHRGRNPGAR